MYYLSFEYPEMTGSWKPIEQNKMQLLHVVLPSYIDSIAQSLKLEK